jgi:hypothetical protein
VADDQEQETEPEQDEVLGNVPCSNGLDHGLDGKQREEPNAAERQPHSNTPRPRARDHDTQAPESDPSATIPAPTSATNTASTRSEGDPKTSSPPCPAKISTPARIAATPVRDLESDAAVDGA